MKSLASILLLAAVSSLGENVDARSSKGANVIGKAVRNRAAKSIVSEKPRFLQFFGDLLSGVAQTAIGIGTGMMPGMGGGMMPGMNGSVMPGQAPQPEGEAPAAPKVDLNATKGLQEELEKKIADAKTLGEQIADNVDTIEAQTGANDKKGVELKIDVMDPQTSVEMKQEQAAEAAVVAAAPPPMYSAPVIVLLPPEPTPIEKLEFARAVACRGKMASPEAKAQRAAELAEISTIKGRTLSDLLSEEKAAEAQLEKEKADRNKIHQELRQVDSNKAAGASSETDQYFLKEDLKLQDQKIQMILDKLKRIETRIHRLRRSGAKGSNKKGKKEAEKEEEGEEEEEEEED